MTWIVELPVVAWTRHRLELPDLGEFLDAIGLPLPRVRGETAVPAEQHVGIKMTHMQ